MGKIRGVTVYLLEGEASSAREFVKGSELLDSQVREFPIALGQGDGSTSATVFVQHPKRRPPRWVEFFSGYVPASVFGEVGSTGATLVLQRSGRWFALSFGHGRFLLDPSRVTEGFGLRVTLNAVAPGSLRSIDKETFDAIASHSRQQSIKGAEPAEFGLDVERDMVRAVTGAPVRPVLGQKLAGMNSLAISGEIDIEGVPEILDELSIQYQSERYKDHYPWIDNVKSVLDAGDVASLDAALVKRVLAGELEATWLAPPEVLDWAHARYFSYSKAADNLRVDIHWRTWLASAKAHLDAALLRRRRIFCLDENAHPVASWSVYQCVYADLEFHGGRFILTGGHWYRVAADFVAEVDEWLRGVPRLDGYLPAFDHESEALYNQAVADERPDQFLLMDRKLVQYGGHHGSVELCDLLGRDGALVHVKRYGASSSLSHLFSQGLVSGQLLKVDAEFRAALKPLVPAGYWQECRLESGAAEGRKVVFGIVQRSASDLVLPFFSRITLRQAARTLTGFGYEVCLARIPMSELRAVLSRARPRRRRGPGPV